MKLLTTYTGDEIYVAFVMELSENHPNAESISDEVYKNDIDLGPDDILNVYVDDKGDRQYELYTNGLKITTF